jgi:alpha-amylase
MYKILFLSVISCLIFTNCKNDKSTVENKNTKVDFDFNTPDWAKNATIYEVNTRQYSKEGNFEEIQKQLPRLKEMGVKILWLMPIYPICETQKKCHKDAKTECLGSPYAVYDFESINPKYGNEADFKELVTEIHKLDMKVILDFVPDHTGWDSKWMKEHPEYFKKKDGKFTIPYDPKTGNLTDWTDVAMLDYDNLETRKAVINAHKYWIEKFDVDGYREDVAGFVPSSFWKELRLELNKLKQVYMLSEWEDVTDHFDNGFEANYGWDFHHLIKDIAQGKKKANELDTYLKNHRERFNPKGSAMLFTQNHDENTWNGTLKESFGDAGNTFTAFCHVFEGVGLVYGGQEGNLDKRLWLFNKDEIKWDNYPNANFFKTLLALKSRNKALWNGLNGGKVEKINTNADDKVYAFVREKEGDKVVGVFNMSKNSIDVALSGEKYVGTYSNIFANSSTTLTKDIALKLKPWDFLIFTNK